MPSGNTHAFAQYRQVTPFLPPLITALSESQVDIVSSNNLSHEEWKSDLQVLGPGRDETADAAEPRPLLVRQLVLRRGLTVLFMVLVLGAGILINKMLLKMLK